MKRTKERKKRKIKNKLKKIKDFLAGKLLPKPRAPHKPQKTHRDKSKYSRKDKHKKPLA